MVTRPGTTSSEQLGPPCCWIPAPQSGFPASNKSLESADAIERARRAGEPIFLSPITAWELGLLVSRGRMNLQMAPERWFARLMEAPGLRLAGMTPNVLIGSSFLPGAAPRDLADRIIAATAREFGYQVVTRDRPLLAYAGQGHIQALPR